MVDTGGTRSTDIFTDRREAGRRLAQAVAAKSFQGRILVLGLPRGGVPVAFEVAKELQAPLDIWLVRKLGVPGQEEVAMGALASGGVSVMNDDVVRALAGREQEIESEVAREKKELARREREYRGDRALPEIQGRTVIVVDDGLATGASMRAALKAVRAQNPARLIVAAPVGAPEVCRDLADEGAEVVCLLQPRRFQAVGFWYRNFTQTTDQEVRDILDEARSLAI